jgi:hypothetical protein
MLNLRKKTLALAVAGAAVLGAGLGTGIPTAQAQAIGGNYLGQALIYPYYSVRDGWRTFIHVVNTSAQTVAAKVVFRDARFSRDVFDFIVVLSPRDMWTGVVEERGGVPGFRPTDNTCTVPQIGSGNFVGFDPLGTVPAIDDMREGYVEIIQMGSPPNENDPIAVAAKHNDTTGIPTNCGTVASNFDAQAVPNWNLYPAQALTGKYDMVNVNAATLSTSASRAVAIQNFNGATLMYPAGGALPNLACAQQGPNPAVCAGIVAAQTALNATSIVNEWVLNPGLGELSSWVVTFPTKALSLDPATTNVPQPNAVFVNRAGCGNNPAVPVTLDLRNREEKPQSFSPNFVDLCNEVNVINFTSSAISSAGLLASAVAKTINTTALNTQFLGGWARLTHLNNPTNAAALLPAVGFNITARTKLGDAVLYDHAYPGRVAQ